MSATPKKARILLVEDHAMFRERLAHLINQDPEMSVCAEADNIRDAMEKARTSAPDAALVDITLKGSSGLEFVKDLKTAGMNLPILVLSMHEESLYAERVIGAGARGYITKHQSSSTLLKAIRRILSGEVYLSEEMTSAILKKSTGEEPKSGGINKLADRELEVFQLIGSGRSTREIAAALNLGITTVETYRTRIKEKLGIRHAADLQHKAAIWMREGNIEAL